MTSYGPFCRFCGVSIRAVAAGSATHAPACKLEDRSRAVTPRDGPAVGAVEEPRDWTEVPWDQRGEQTQLHELCQACGGVLPAHFAGCTVTPGRDAPPKKADEKPEERDPRGRFVPGNQAGVGRGRPRGSIGFARRIRDSMWREHQGVLRATKDADGNPAGEVVGGDFLDKVVRVANDPLHPQWTWACDYLTARGYGKAPEKVMISGPKDGPLEVKHSGSVNADGDRFEQILAVLQRAGALPSGPEDAAATADPAAQPVHEAGSDAAAGGVSPVAPT